MDTTLQMFLIVLILMFLMLILYFISKKELNLKYSLTWLLSGFILLIIAIFPQIVNRIGSFVGIISPVNTIFLFSGMFTILILLTLTFIVSRLNNRIYKLTQTIALIEKRVRECEEAKKMEKD